MFCPNCGNMITDETKFCGNCGTKVNNIINDDPIQSEIKTNSEIDNSIINENTTTNIKTQKDNTKTLINILKVLVIILLIGIVILIIQFLSDKPNKESNNDNKNQNNNVVWIPEDNHSTDITEDETKEPNIDILDDETKPSGSVINQDNNKTINSFSFAGYTLNSNISYDLKCLDESIYLITEGDVIINLQYHKDVKYDDLANNLDILKKVIQQYLTKKKYIVGMPAEYIRNGIKYVDVAIYDKANNLCSRIICTGIGESEGVFVAIQNAEDYEIYSNTIDMFVNAKKTIGIYNGTKDEFKFPDFEMIFDIFDGFI